MNIRIFKCGKIIINFFFFFYDDDDFSYLYYPETFFFSFLTINTLFSMTNLISLNWNNLQKISKYYFIREPVDQCRTISKKFNAVLKKIISSQNLYQDPLFCKQEWIEKGGSNIHNPSPYTHLNQEKFLK